MGAQGGGAGGRSRVMNALRAGRSLTPVLLALFVLFSPAPAWAATPSSQGAPRILSIGFEGNEHLSARALRSQMRLREPDWWKPFSHPTYLGPDFLAGDLRAILSLYQQAGYPLARIEQALVSFNEKGDGVRIVIRLSEGPLVKVGEFSLRGLDPSWRSEIVGAGGIDSGEPLSWPKLLDERRRVLEFCSDRGHALAWSDLSARYHGDTADVVLDADPGPLVRVDSVRVMGLRDSRAPMVTRELLLKPGDLLRTNRIAQSQERLLNTGVFTRARITTEFPDSTKPLADLLVNVEERRRAWFESGAGYSSASLLSFLAGWGLRNLRGMGRQLAVNGELQYSLDPQFRGGGVNFKTGLFQFDYLEPWLFGTRTRGDLKPYINWLHDQAFNQRTIGAELTLGRDLSLYQKASVSLKSEWVTTTESGNLPHYTTHLLSPEYDDDRRDNPFDPTRGYYVQGTAVYAGGILLGGTNQYAGLTATWQGYKSPWRGLVLAARAKAGQLYPIGLGPLRGDEPDTLRLSHIPISDRFRLGGGNSVRGYGEGDLGRHDPNGQPTGGLILLLANLEARFPLFWIVQGGLFVDMGNVWAEGSEIGIRRFVDGLRQHSYDPLNVAYGVGGGLRFRTPVGPFRFDYGLKVGSGRRPGQGRGELHVALGQAF